ncbi:MAG: DNA repair exonuclease [Rhodothermales bacterium]|nr:DNA repair exonuclease [Rhodothermales bacterium]
MPSSKSHTVPSRNVDTRARLLHLADLHFDAPLKCKGEALRAELRSAAFTAFSVAVSDAIEHEVDAVLIAGDLFDGSRISVETELHVRSEFERLEDRAIPVYIVTGNHDPAVGHNGLRRIEWPENVRIIGATNPVSIEVESRSSATSDQPALVLVAAGHEHSAHSENLVSAFPRVDTSVPHVGLVHAMVSSPSSSGDSERHKRYAPCTVEDLKSAGYCYWALGHVHVPGNIAGTVANYAGCLQGRHHKEGGDRGGYIVTIGADGTAEAVFRNYAPLVWVQVVLEGNLPDEIAELESQVAVAVEGLRRTHEDRRLAVRIVLNGQSVLSRVLSDSDELEILSAKWVDELDLAAVELDAGGVFANVDIGRLRSEPTVVAESIALIEQMIQEVSDSESVRTPRIPTELLEGIVSDAAEMHSLRWRELLQGLHLEVAERMVDLPNYKPDPR